MHSLSAEKLFSIYQSSSIDSLDIVISDSLGTFLFDISQLEQKYSISADCSLWSIAILLSLQNSFITIQSSFDSPDNWIVDILFRQVARSDFITILLPLTQSSFDPRDNWIKDILIRQIVCSNLIAILFLSAELFYREIIK